MGVVWDVHHYVVKHHSRLIYGVLLVGIIFRILYLFEIKDGPLVRWHEWTESDNSFFHTWALEIKNGDLWTDQELHPFHHKWYEKVSSDYYNAHLGEASFPLDEFKNSPPFRRARLFWSKFYNGKQFHQEPFYSYFLAGSYFFFGEDTYTVFWIQAILGVISIYLLYLVGLRYFNPTIGLGSAAVVVFYGPLLFYESNLLRASFITFFALLLVERFGWVHKKGMKLWSYGLVVGMAILLKSIFLLFLFYILTVLVIIHWKSRIKLTVHLTILLSGVLLALSPAIIRNLKVDSTLSPLSLASNGPSTFAQGNNPDFREELFAGEVAQIMVDGNGEVVGTIYQTLKRHSWESFAHLMYYKFRRFLLGTEWPNNNNFYVARESYQMLRWSFINFYVVGPLGILGLLFYLFSGKVKYRNPLIAMIFLLSFVLVAIIVYARFRIPIAILLIPFALYTIQLFFEGGVRQKSIILLFFVAYSFFNWQNRWSEDETIRTGVYRTIEMKLK